jgi:cobalt-precorrin-5B (C1)-methyltransferase
MDIKEAYEPELSEPIKKAKKTLATGYTTGTCAAAAAKAAAILYKTGELPDKVTITLPKGQQVTLPILPPVVNLDGAGATVKKYAGDDPDCTDGALITVHLIPHKEPFHTFKAGPGVGVVTLEGLGIKVGEPSITKVPREMIKKAVSEIISDFFIITISVPGGQEMAKQTTNERLGIMGGISILGTTGVVKPFSTAAYRASVAQQIDVAAYQNLSEVVFAIGSRSDAIAQKLFNLPPLAFIEVGDFTGLALKRAVLRHIQSVHFVAMAGKLTKLASGVMMTHFHKSNIDTSLLRKIALETNSPEVVVKSATKTATARHFFETCVEHNTIKPLQMLCELAKQQMLAFINRQLLIDVTLIDFDAKQVIARS